MAEMACRKCGRALHNTFDLCPACRAELERLEDDRKRQTRAAEEAARVQRDAAFEKAVWDEQVGRDRKAFAEQERDEQRREYVSRLIAAADSMKAEAEAVPDDAGARLAFLAKLAAFFPKSWEEWLVADGVVPHRVDVAYAQHRAVVVPLLEAAVVTRLESPASPDRLLRALATSFLLKDFDAIRRVQRDLPDRLEPTRQRARDVVERIKALTAQQQVKRREIADMKDSFLRGTFSALKGRTEAVIEDEILALDADIAREKQVIAGLEGEAKRAKAVFELSRGDLAVRSILEAVNGGVELLEATPSAGDPVPNHPSVSAADLTLAPLPEPDAPPAEFGDEELWQVARRWASRHQHVVFWLLVGLTFPLELLCLVGVAASGSPLAAVVAVPFAFLPLVLMGFAVEKTKRFIEYRRRIVGVWQASRPDGAWRLQFTDEGTLILNDSQTTGYVLFGNLELVVASEQVRAVLGERVVSLGENELVLIVGGTVCRFTRTA